MFGGAHVKDKSTKCVGGLVKQTDIRDKLAEGIPIGTDLSGLATWIKMLFKSFWSLR